MKTQFAVLTLLLLTFSASCVRAQAITDGFADGNFLAPFWEGDTTVYEINDGFLVLGESNPGQRKINLQLPLREFADTIDIEFLVEMDVQVDGNNEVVVGFLNDFPPNQWGSGFSIDIVSNSNFPGNIYGFFRDFDVGGLILEGEPGRLLTDSLRVRIQLRRLPSGIFIDINEEREFYDWIFSADYSGGADFVPQDTFQAFSDYLPNNMFVQLLEEEPTGKVRVGEMQVINRYEIDTIGPQLLEGSFPDYQSIELLFDDTLDQFSAPFLVNYALNIPDINIVAVEVGLKSVVLQTDNPFTFNEPVEVTVIRIMDDDGYISFDQVWSAPFQVVVAPFPGSIIITEVMFKPSPEGGLPESEYIELYNPLDSGLNLNLAYLRAGNARTPRFKDYVFPGKSYLVITDETFGAALVEDGVKAIGTSFPTLSNTASFISIQNLGQSVSELRYTRNWHDDLERDNSGYSLEYTGLSGEDPECNSNWKTSIDPLGGTPGLMNSHLLVLDTFAAEVIEATAEIDFIEITFNEDIPSLQFEITDFSISPEVPILSLDQDGTRTFVLEANLEREVEYILTIQPNFTDCVGNVPAEALQVPFHVAWPVPIAGIEDDLPLDIVAVNPATSRELVVHYGGVEAGYKLRGRVLDLLGREIAVLNPNDLSADGGVIRWSAPSLKEGAYVVAFELVGNNGKRVLFGRKVVVGL